MSARPLDFSGDGACSPWSGQSPGQGLPPQSGQPAFLAARQQPTRRKVVAQPEPTGERRARGIPIHSVFVGDPSWDGEARDRVYVEEIARQSRVFSDALGKAVALSLSADASDDSSWGYLQGALFASVVVCRVLKPSRRSIAPTRA